jgi:alpha-glucosidase
MRILTRIVAALAVLLASRAATAQIGWQTSGDVSSFEKRPDGIDVHAQRGRVRITVLSPTVIRVQYSLQEKFSERPSFAVLPDAFPGETPNLQVEDSTQQLSLSTGALVIRIEKSPLRIAFQDASGKVIEQDQPNRPPTFNVAAKGTAFKVWKTMPEDEHYFGLGDKTGPMDHRNLAFTMWNTDQFGWQESTDPLYKDIPFIFGLRNGSAYGLFLDNTYRSSFDFGKEFHDAYSFGSEGGDLDYYFFYGPDPKRVVKQYTQLVGRMPLPPLFALGYQQCRYSYYPESQVREIASQFRKRKIPADVIYLDIDYQQDNRPFYREPAAFPEFRRYVERPWA